MNRPKMYGVIHIGSDELRLRIAQKEKTKMVFIETLRYPLSLGRDTFNNGKISFEKVDKTCEAIRNFLQVLTEYGVTNYRVVATTAIREATNRNYILDQIKIKTGVEIEVIDDTQEKLYIYKLMFHLLDREYKLSSMLVHIGSGNIGFNVLQNEKFIFTQTIKIGTLRIFEIFEKIQDYSNEFYKIVEEYLNSFTEPFSDIVNYKISNFIASGHEISLIGDLCGANAADSFLVIPRENFFKLYDDIKSKTVENICSSYGLTMDRAEILLPALSVYKNLLKFTNAKEIIAPMVFLSDGICFEKMFHEEYQAISKTFYKNAVSYSKILASRFDVNLKHSEFVEKYALEIFDKMKKVHGLSKNEKLILSLSAILHDIGKFINPRDHHFHSFNIINASSLIGVSDREALLVANTAFFHSSATPSENFQNYRDLTRKEKVILSKLTAILRLADALDRSHSQKIKDVGVKIEDNQIILTINTNRNIELEQWSVKLKGQFFEEVFGLKIVLKSKKVS